VSLHAASLLDAPEMARVHARCFPAPWDTEEIGDLLTAPGGFGLVIKAPPLAGFILCRALAGEAEVLTLAIEPDLRGQGLGQALLQAAIGVAHAKGAEAMFLEVAADNRPAIALYRRNGFDQVGLRRGYYPNQGGAPVDALVYRRPLNSDPLSAYV
jgi:ribosomal-protein-alanine N-acetyltransferase